EVVLPDEIARVGIEAHDALLNRFSLAQVIDEIDAAIEDQRRGARAVRGLPDHGPIGGQIGFRRDAGLPGAAPVMPVGGAGGEGERQQRDTGNDRPTAHGLILRRSARSASKGALHLHLLAPRAVIHVLYARAAPSSQIAATIPAQRASLGRGTVTRRE